MNLQVSKRLWWGVLVLVAMQGALARSDESLKGIACRSVHLGYPGRDVTRFYNEVTPRASAPGTFLMVCGWDAGYFGLQELGNGKKLVIFSVWDNARGDNPDLVDEEQRVKLVHQHPAVRVGRFGGEGTGGQSFFDFDWKLDTTYRFMMTAEPEGKRTTYSGYLYDEPNSQWIKLIAFSTVTGGKKGSGLYSFIEDFKRDRKSTRFNRRAEFGNGWTFSDDQWRPITSARFTADANPVMNIDAGVGTGSFYLTTGGEIRNENTKLRDTIELGAREPELPTVLTQWPGESND
jgi:hypothetical protein